MKKKKLYKCAYKDVKDRKTNWPDKEFKNHLIMTHKLNLARLAKS